METYQVLLLLLCSSLASSKEKYLTIFRSCLIQMSIVSKEILPAFSPILGLITFGVFDTGNSRGKFPVRSQYIVVCTIKTHIFSFLFTSQLIVATEHSYWHRGKCANEEFGSWSGVFGVTRLTVFMAPMRVQSIRNM